MNASAAFADDETASTALVAFAGLPAAKRIAAVALYLQAMRSPLSREAALACAARAYGIRFGLSPSGLKKAVSEGRAILQFGLADGRFLEEVARLRSSDMLAALEIAVRRVSLREVTRARAALLAGGRGGRPMARPTPAYAAVRKLLELAEAGDATARAELSAICDLIRGPRPGYVADHPVASR
ncbi:hypothetical protein [Phenylobacterium sp. VNQ135]|uniref:hypothetical protein n=1 Tax=Phenylobacterium sp. VNQ135 TaxID=3400922 RepID=UPI003C2D191F